MYNNALIGSESFWKASQLTDFATHCKEQALNRPYMLHYFADGSCEFINHWYRPLGCGADNVGIGRFTYETPSNVLCLYVGELSSYTATTPFLYGNQISMLLGQLITVDCGKLSREEIMEDLALDASLFYRPNSSRTDLVNSQQ